MVNAMEIRDLGYAYQKKTVLDSIRLGIGKGKIIGILGPNGCGKSTLLKNLNRNLSPLHGCVMVNDTDIAGITKKEIAKKIAVVPQTNEVTFAFTVREIVEMGRMPFLEPFRGMDSKDIEAVEKAIDAAGLRDMQDRLINTMSGGERQRAIIARAIAQTPEILLMDEPTLHLDINMQFEVLDLVRKLCDENGLTVVIVSHDLPMAARYCDEIAMIHDHNILCYGTPEEVLTPGNMRTIFNVEAEFGTDPFNGRKTVYLHGSAAKRQDKYVTRIT